MPISEIITVEETDVNGKQYSSGKWQKMEKPYAFTGNLLKPLVAPGRSHERELLCHLLNGLPVSLVYGKVLASFFQAVFFFFTEV